MRIKLDENFDVRLVPLISQGGHDVDTVMEEKLTGQPDEAIYRACLCNKQVLFTLDMHFSNPLRFPSDQTEGIVVLRLPRPILPLIRAALAAALPELSKRSLRGQLWIVGRDESACMTLGRKGFERKVSDECGTDQTVGRGRDTLCLGEISPLTEGLLMGDPSSTSYRSAA